MNGFDFSAYDFSDYASPLVDEEEGDKSGFDFDKYDLTAIPKEKNTPTPSYKNPFEVREVSKDEYNKMSQSEKIQYAKNLDKEQRFDFSKGLSKSLGSSLSFGATENILGFEPEESDNPYGSFLGNVVGNVLPIAGAAKVASIPVKAAFKNAPKILQPLQNLMQAFGTGAVYETGKQGVNVASGKEADLSQIPITGGEFATLDLIFRGLGKAAQKTYSKFKEFSPSQQAQILEQKVVPKDLPKSQFDTAQEMLKIVEQQKQNNYLSNFPGAPPSPPGGSAPSKLLPERITAPKDIGLRPVKTEANPAIEDQVGSIFSKNKFYNTTEGGQALRNEIMNIDEDVYRGVNDLYKTSRELNSEINEIHPQLANRIKNRVLELEAIPEPSDVQKRLIKASNNILEKIAAFDESGNPTGYIPINNQILIDQVQSLRQIIDYDFAHGNTKNIFRPLINDLQDAALRAAETSGKPEAAEAINEARSAYRTWVEAFDNDYVRPFRDSSNQDYSKLFKSSLDLDEANMLNKILGITERGQELSKAATREIVDKHLSKYFQNPRSFDPREFSKSLRELEAVITPEQSQDIREKFRDASQRINVKATHKPRKPTNDELIAARYEKNKPEDIIKMMDSRSGIKQLHEDFSDTKVKREVFERLSRQKMRSMLREGNIEKEFTGDDLYRFLNKEKNYEIFSEIIGENETESLRSVAKEIGKEQVKKEARKKGATKALRKLAGYKSIEIILSLI